MTTSNTYNKYTDNPNNDYYNMQQWLSSITKTISLYSTVYTQQWLLQCTRMAVFNNNYYIVSQWVHLATLTTAHWQLHSSATIIVLLNDYYAAQQRWVITPCNKKYYSQQRSLHLARCNWVAPCNSITMTTPLGQWPLCCKNTLVHCNSDYCTAKKKHRLLHQWLLNSTMTVNNKG